MKAITTILLASFLLLAGVAHTAEVAATSVEDFVWLVGCWKGESEGKQFTENWMRPLGTMMQGLSRTTKEGRQLNNELLKIVKKSDGIYYLAKPFMQRETPFKLVRSGFRQATFENPEHDFPQRIIYRLEKDDSLFARIEGMVDGQQQAVDYPMKRVKCDVGAIQ